MPQYRLLLERWGSGEALEGPRCTPLALRKRRVAAVPCLAAARDGLRLTSTFFGEKRRVWKHRQLPWGQVQYGVYCSAAAGKNRYEVEKRFRGNSTG